MQPAGLRSRSRTDKHWPSTQPTWMSRIRPRSGAPRRAERATHHRRHLARITLDDEDLSPSRAALPPPLVLANGSEASRCLAHQRSSLRRSHRRHELRPRDGWQEVVNLLISGPTHTAKSRAISLPDNTRAYKALRHD